MAGLNKAILIGYLGADPELKYTQGGQAILKIRMATTERFKNQAGEAQERTEWHTVTVWGKLGETLSKMLVKGKQVYVEGRIQTRSYEDKNGGPKRYSTDINATSVILLGGRESEASDERSGRSSGGGYGGHAGGGYGGGQGHSGQGGRSRPSPSPAPADDFPSDDFVDDDIPF